jgi:hypothetical protein
MNSMAFSLLANSSTEVDENQEMELTIGSLRIFIGPSGSTRLSDPTKQDPSASEPEIVAVMVYSEGSSSEVNSPVSLGEVQKGKIAEDDETMENFDVGVQLEDLMICHNDISDKSTYTWKTGLELSEDGDSIFSSFNNNIGKQCQVLAIVGDNSEEFDENNNPVLNPANIDRGANHLAEGQTTESLTTREKNSTISQRMEGNKGSCGKRHTNTIKFQQGHAPGVSLCPKAAGKATGKGENRGTKKKRLSHCSQQRRSQSAKRRITY